MSELIHIYGNQYIALLIFLYTMIDLFLSCVFGDLEINFMFLSFKAISIIVVYILPKNILVDIIRCFYSYRLNVNKKR
ncbi:MAG: hypothetical protein ACRCXT_18760 [Paraclostridium sp.]